MSKISTKNILKKIFKGKTDKKVKKKVSKKKVVKAKKVKKTKKTPTPSPPKQQQIKSKPKSIPKPRGSSAAIKGKGPLIKRTPKPEPKSVETPDLLSELAKKDRKDILMWMEKNMNLE